MPPLVTCALCDRVFTKRCSLNRHLSRVHDFEAKCPRKAVVCPVENCGETFSYHAPLRSHLTSVHLVHLQDEQRTFPSMKDFFEWKKGEEQRYLIKYVKACGVQQLLDGTEVFRFNCHRTGTYNPEGKGLRRLKSEGSCKIGASCPSTVTAHLHPNGSVHCFYCMTHVGHKCVIQDTDVPADVLMELDFRGLHSPVTRHIPQEPRELPVVKVIRSQKPFTSIGRKMEFHSSAPDSCHSNAISSTVHPVSQATTGIADVHTESIDEVFDNIWRLSNARTYERFQNHVTYFEDSNLFACLKNSESYSQVAALSEELNGNQEEMLSKTITWKQSKDTTGDLVDATDALPSSFKLFVMNSWQVDVLRRLANNGVLCVDTVYGRDPKNYVIVAVFVQDADKRGWLLCAMFFCFGVTYENMEVCFSKIKNKTGILNPKVIMSEDDERIYSSWEKVMGKFNQWLLCPWHIDKSVRGKLRNIAAEPTILVYIYESVHTLMDSCFLKKFDDTFELLLKDLAWTEPHQTFLAFLRETFMSKKSLWPNFDGSELEALHLVVQYVGHQAQKTLSQALFSLFLFFREGHLKCSCFDETAKHSVVTDILSEHKASLSLNVSAVCPFGSQCIWSVKIGNVEYIVSQARDTCPGSCDVKCAACNTCLHSFSCSCLCNSVQWLLCRHIHLVGRFLESSEKYTCHNKDLQNMIAEEAATLLDDDCVEKSMTSADPTKMRVCNEILSDIQEYTHHIAANSSVITDQNKLLQIKASLKTTLKLFESLPVTEIRAECHDVEEECASQHERQLNNRCVTSDHAYA